MAFRIFNDLQQHCQQYSSFKELAAKLDWSSATLDAFFNGEDQSLDSLIRVAHAMGLDIDLLFTQKITTPTQSSGE